MKKLMVTVMMVTVIAGAANALYITPVPMDNGMDEVLKLCSDNVAFCSQVQKVREQFSRNNTVAFLNSTRSSVVGLYIIPTTFKGYGEDLLPVIVDRNEWAKVRIMAFGIKHRIRLELTNGQTVDFEDVEISSGTKVLRLLETPRGYMISCL